MNIKLSPFLIVLLFAAMSLTQLAQQLIPTGTETAAGLLLSRTALAQTAPKAKDVVLVHGLFADGSSWSEVIPRLQAAGLNATSVQTPLTTLPEAVDAALRVFGRQNGPMVLAGHSFSGMIVTEAGVHPNVSALVYVAARAPDAGEDYAALAKQFPTPPASAGIIFDILWLAASWHNNHEYRGLIIPFIVASHFPKGKFSETGIRVVRYQTDVAIISNRFRS